MLLHVEVRGKANDSGKKTAALIRERGSADRENRDTVEPYYYRIGKGRMGTKTANVCRKGERDLY